MYNVKREYTKRNNILDIETLLNIAKRKNEYDINNPWSNGSKTYLDEIKKEINEVIEELNNNRNCYLEEELGDVLWDYLSIIINLEKERNISLSSIITRACKKYDERISGIENGIEWDQIKKEQKMRLAEEQKKIDENIIIKGLR